MLETKKNRNHTIEAQLKQNRSFLIKFEYRQAVIRKTETSLMLNKEQTVWTLNAMVFFSLPPPLQEKAESWESFEITKSIE